MKISWHFFTVAAGIFVASIALAFLAPTTDIFKGIFALPGVCALVAALYQLLRDQAAHDREIALQRRAQIFNLSVTSHMANVAFDKHVAFCEDYLNELNEVLRALFRSGPSQDALHQSSRLGTIRLKYPAWVTQEMQDKLIKFERALDSVGLHGMRLKDLPVGDERTKAVTEMYNAFAKITGTQHLREGSDMDAVAASEIILYVRSLLGVDELAKLRAEVIAQAIKSLS